MEHTEGCLLCGAPLVYQQGNIQKNCAVCGKSYPANVWCENGHYICDECHSTPAISVIRQTCMEEGRKEAAVSPILLANELMKHSAIKMHGPEHHFLVPAVLLTAAASISERQDELPVLLELAASRAKNVLGGFCGYYGACGSAVGAGIFMSVWTDATPLSDESWADANEMTSRCLHRIAQNGGPRCCKRGTYTSITTAVQFANQKLGLAIPLPERIFCLYSARNRECKKEACPFYPNNNV